MRVTAVISSLGRGGAERVLSQLTRRWAAQGDTVTLVTLAARSTDREVLPGVERVALDRMGTSRTAVGSLLRSLGRVRALRRAIRASRPDVVLAFMTPTTVLVLLACRGLDVPVVVAERVDPAAYIVPRYVRWLRRQLYPRAACVVAQTARAAEALRALAPGCRTEVVRGFVQAPDATRREAGQAFVAVGRLVHQKGFDLLLRSFAMSAPSLPTWRLRIVGDGPEEPALRALAESLGVGARVELTGGKERPWEHLPEDGVFVLSSRFEGFPNALLEAMAMGLPPVAFDCPSGPAEIIDHGHNGLLVPAEDVGALASAMTRLALSREERLRLGDAAVNVRNTWGEADALAAWGAVLQAAARRA